MQPVIADTGPINYLILIDHIDILAALFEEAYDPLPLEMNWQDQKLRPWSKSGSQSPWTGIEVRPVIHVHDPALGNLDAGEEDAIALAVEAPRRFASDG